MSFSWKEMFMLGWPILSILLLCSVISLAIVLERFVYFSKRKVDIKDFFAKIDQLLAHKEAMMNADILGEPMASITKIAIMQTKSSPDMIDVAVDRAVRMQIADAERSVPLLGTIAGAAPFIGLLGTVIGIIRAFRTLAVSGAGGPQSVMGGISEALVATALGLIVAIPALVFYNHFSTRIRRMTEAMEICSDQLVESLTRALRGDGRPHHESRR